MTTTTPLRVGVLGASGYMGGEALRVLLEHVANRLSSDDLEAMLNAVVNVQLASGDRSARGTPEM